jgi:hypothetical protein
MQRAGQTPHGARPNREGFQRKLKAHRLGAPQPPGRSLEPRSNAWPRGMTVPQHSCCGQNSAYRSGCQVKRLRGILHFVQDFGNGLPLRSRPFSASTYRSGCHALPRMATDPRTRSETRRGRHIRFSSDYESEGGDSVLRPPIVGMALRIVNTHRGTDNFHSAVRDLRTHPLQLTPHRTRSPIICPVR